MNKTDKLLQSLDLTDINEYLENKNITDIDWNGKDLWVNDITRGRLKIENKKLSNEFVDSLSVRIANAMNKSLNRFNPILEAETEDLRFSVFHESIANGVRTLSIRKTPKIMRLSRDYLIETGYLNEQMCNFFINAIKAHCSMVICGLPSVGKTEFLKFLTSYIPDYERVITIEDRREIHYADINPNKDVIEVKISENLTFPDAISAALSHNAKWTILSEARGEEVEYLMNNLSSGTHVLTTLHTNDVRKVPDRLANMLPGGQASERFIDNAYDFIDIGVLITSKVRNGEKISRRIEQIGAFSRQDGENVTSIIYEDKKLNTELPEELLKKFHKAGIMNPFERQENVTEFEQKKREGA